MNPNFFLPGTNLSLKVQARMEDKVRIKYLKSLLAFFEKFGRATLILCKILGTLPYFLDFQFANCKIYSIVFLFLPVLWEGGMFLGLFKPFLGLLNNNLFCPFSPKMVVMEQFLVPGLWLDMLLGLGGERRVGLRVTHIFCTYR